MATLPLGVIHAWLFWPGIMIWDSGRQYGQALSGNYDDWHPPAMSWLWRQMLSFGPGPAAMLIVQLALYWGGIALLVDAAVRAGRRRGGVVLLAVALLPVPWLLMGAVIKDSLMAALLVMATGLLARRPLSATMSRGAALVLLVAAATLRFNAVPACLPLAIAALPDRWARDWRLPVSAAACLIPLVLALPLANHALGAARSGVEQSLVIYDLGGITRFSGQDQFPDVGVADPVRVNAGCYTPVAWDRYAWWGADPCDIGFELLHPVLSQQGASRLWLGAILRHPLAYAEHRLLHFNAEQRLIVRDADLPGLPVASDPNPGGFRLTLATPLRTVARRVVTTPLGWPACWLAFGLGLLATTWRSARPPLAMPLILSALLYEASYLPLGVASEVRYHLWTMTALGLAATLLGCVGLGRRIAAAAAPAILAALCCFVARELLG